MTVSNYSTTSANNTLINSISIAEGMPPSNVNNVIRNELADLRTARYNGSSNGPAASGFLAGGSTSGTTGSTTTEEWTASLANKTITSS